MGRASRAWVGTIIAAGCAAASFVWPIAAAFGSVGVLVAHVVLMMAVNRSSTRLAHLLALGLFVGATVRVTGSWYLGAAALVCELPSVPTEATVRRLGYKMMWLMPGALLGALPLVALAWAEARYWVFSVTPLLLFQVMGTMMTVKGMGELAKFNRPSWKIKIGAPVPDFTLKDRGEAEFRLSEQKGKHVLIAFMRGDWCPVCHVKMRLLQREAPSLAKANVKLAIVSPDGGADSVAFARDAGLDLTILSDPENTVAKIFDAVQPNVPKEGKDAPLPCSSLVDPDGKLAHASRPDDIASFLDPAAVIRLLDKEGLVQKAA